jgi:hypothetical protein
VVDGGGSNGFGSVFRKAQWLARNGWSAAPAMACILIGNLLQALYTLFPQAQLCGYTSAKVMFGSLVL